LTRQALSACDTFTVLSGPLSQEQHRQNFNEKFFYLEFIK